MWFTAGEFDPIGIRGVFDADDVVATAVRKRVDVALVDKDVVDAPVQLIVVAGDDPSAVRRVADVEPGLLTSSPGC